MPSLALMSKVFCLLGIFVLLIGCAGSPSGSVDRSYGGAALNRLVADVIAAGGKVQQAGTFDATPMQGGEGQLLCVGAEEVRVYAFSTEQARQAAANTIDPDDPSHVGRSIVDWTGNPRFWQRDTLIVLYLGTDAATEGLLTRVLGQPFAKGSGRALGGPGLSGCGVAPSAG